jgi:hypothetical protein
MHSACLVANALPALLAPAWKMNGVRWMDGSVVNGPADLKYFLCFGQ